MFRRTILVAMAALMCMFASASAISAQSGMAKVRVVHASPDAPAVDVWVDGNKALTNVPFFAASDYLELAAGNHDLKVVATGTTEPAVIDAKGVAVEAGKAYTIAAVGKLADIKPAIFVDDLTAPAAGKAHVRVLHLSPDAPGVDVKVANGATLIPNLVFPKASNYLPVDAGSYDLQVTPAGASAVVLNLAGTKLEAGKIYDVFAVGELANIRAEVKVTTPAASTGTTTPAPTTLPTTGGGDMSLGLAAIVAAGLIAGGISQIGRASCRERV